MLKRLLTNHVFTNLTFGLVLVIGFLAYGLLPRQQDPDMNFNWIHITTALPGASAGNVERLVTEPLEDAVRKISGTRFVSSNSREGVSTILVRFQDMSERVFDKKVADLRREIRNKERELPPEAEDPFILEITSANGFPTAMVVVQGRADDENLRRHAHHVRKDLEQLKGVDQVLPIGLNDPELHVRFLPAALPGPGVTPMALADTVAGRFRDVAGGTISVGQAAWLLRMEGVATTPEELARWPVVGPGGEVPLARVAEVVQAREKAVQLVRLNGQPAVALSVTKQAATNALELTGRIREYVAQRNALADATGVRVVLADDQTHKVQEALQVMETNAFLGLLMVMVVTWLFLGSRIALLIGVGIPFTLAGTFGILYTVGWSLNVMVLLGVVIALGMLVDDAVVVVEAAYTRIHRGQEALQAGLDSIREVFAPVTASVLTTMAAFLPLILLPGILGKFMRVIPVVVSVALAISLIEAYWMLPAHVAMMRLDASRPSRLHRWRTRLLHRLQILYVRLLARVLRRPGRSLAAAVVPFLAAVGIVAGGLVRVDFFAMDPFPLFYVNITMPSGTPLAVTMERTVAVEEKVRALLRPGEAREVVSYAGQMMTEIEPLFGDRYGQVMVSLMPLTPGGRGPVEIADSMAQAIREVAGPDNVTLLKLSGGPPVTKPVSVKVRGEGFPEIRAAVADLVHILEGIPAARDISDNDSPGRPEVVFTVNDDGARRAGLPPGQVSRLPRLLADGEVVARHQLRGEQVEVRVLAKPRPLDGLGPLLATPVALPGGGSAPLGNLLDHRVEHGPADIRHYNFRRAITVEADLDKTRMDTVAANRHIQEEWAKIRHRHPTVDLDFSGELDDIYESMDAILTLFLLGVGLMYMILGTQFGSYWQPFMILSTVPMAFTGVALGMLFTGHPMSLYTLYGVVALSGIAVNASIVLISAANARRQAGMGVLHAIIYAARRRVTPILITSFTTVAGLFSLAVGLGGHSLLWGPVATAIVWGLMFSTILTLFLVPLLYWTFMRPRAGRRN